MYKLTNEDIQRIELAKEILEEIKEKFQPWSVYDPKPGGVIYHSIENAEEDLKTIIEYLNKEE